MRNECEMNGKDSLLRSIAEKSIRDVTKRDGKQFIISRTLILQWHFVRTFFFLFFYFTLSAVVSAKTHMDTHIGGHILHYPNKIPFHICSSVRNWNSDWIHAEYEFSWSISTLLWRASRLPAMGMNGLRQRIWNMYVTEWYIEDTAVVYKQVSWTIMRRTLTAIELA